MGKHSLTFTQKVITITSIITALIIAITTVVLAGVSYHKTDLDDDQHRVDELLTNWGNGPIIGIKVTTADECDSGYTPAFNKTWPGADEDCWCGDSTESSRSANGVTCTQFCSGTCSSAQISAGCKTVSGKSYANLTHWGYLSTSAKYTQLCLKRSTKDSWRNNALVSLGDSCPDNYKDCGTNATNRFCTTESTCPYVGFKFSTAQSAALSCSVLGKVTGFDCAILEFDAVTPSYKTIVALTAANVASTGAFPGLPISQFAVNEYGMCYTKTQDNITPGREEYFQLSKKRTTCNQEAAALWGSLDTITETKLFAANSLTSFVSAAASYSETGMSGYYPSGKTGADYSYSLYQQPYVAWDRDFKDELDTFYKNTDLIPRIRKSQKGYLGMTVIGAGFLFVVVFIELLKLCGKINPDGWVNKFKRGLRFLALFAQIPLILWSLLLVSVGRHYFLKISEEEVAENAYVDGNFATFAHHLSQARASTATCFALVVGGLILDLILFCWWRRATRKAKQSNGGVGRIESEATGINAK